MSDNNFFDPSKLDIDFSNVENETPEDMFREEPLKKEDTKKIDKDGDKNSTLDPLNIDNIKKNDENEYSKEKDNTPIKEEVKDNSVIKNENNSQKENKEIKSSDKDSDSLDFSKIDENKQKDINKDEEEFSLGSKEVSKIIFDMNINSLDDVLFVLAKQKYDFLVMEPSTDHVRIVYKKDSVEKDVRYIKYQTYADMLLKAKGSTKMDLQETSKEQKSEGIYNLGNVGLGLTVKTVPTKSGEKLFIKIKAKGLAKKKSSTEDKKFGLTKAITFLMGALLISLIIGGMFLTFILFNSQTVEDLYFFHQLGINIGSIKDFLKNLINGVFLTIVFIETIFLIIFVFKAMITKKEYKAKKRVNVVLSIFFIIITMSTMTLWLTLNKKVMALKGENYGEVVMYDNTKLLSPLFDKDSSKFAIAESLVGPVTVRFDVADFLAKLVDEGITPLEMAWDFGNGEWVEKPVNEYEEIHTFEKTGLYNIVLKISGEDLEGNPKEEEYKIVSLDVKRSIDVQETTLTTGGKKVVYDATNLKNLGDLRWYIIKEKDIGDADISIDNYSYEGDIFRTQNILENSIVLLYIYTKDRVDKAFDKIFMVSAEENDFISGEIKYERSIDDDLDVILWVEGAETKVGYGNIKKFIWNVGDNTQTKNVESINLVEDSKINHIFDTYGDKEVSVTIVDDSDKERTIYSTVNIPKFLDLSQNLVIRNNLEELTNKEFMYNKKSGEYNIYDLGIPTKLQFDAKKIRAGNYLYRLEEVEWDTDEDGDIDKKGKVLDYDINVEGNYVVTANYKFIHIKNKDDIINMKEDIFINTIKKDVLLELEMHKESEYAPVKVMFDASKSNIKGENIQKFIFDYGDGTTPEERDAVNPGHVYRDHGDYEVKLTVITDTGKEYFITKKLILRPKPETINISSSISKSPVGQGIDFSSADSEGQIMRYIWEFGDGDISTEANPSHTYEKPGTYEVSLEVEFANRNILKDSIEIEITD